MKKLLFSMLLAVVSAGASAQGPVEAIGDDQRWVGLYPDDRLAPEDEGWGVPEYPGNNKAAAILEEYHLRPYVGKKVVGIRFGLCRPIGKSRAFIAEASTEDDWNYDIGKEMVSQDVAATRAGWNLVMLDKPFTLEDGKPLCVGFDFEQKATRDAEGEYTEECWPLSIVFDTDFNKTFLYYYDEEEGGWGWYEKFPFTDESLSVQLLVEGFPDYAVTPVGAPTDLPETTALTNTTVNVPVNFFNLSKEAVTDVDYVVSLKGKKLDEQHTRLYRPVAKGTWGTFYASVPTGDKSATLLPDIYVTKVNGHDNGADDNEFAGYVKVSKVPGAYMKNLVIEKFYTESAIYAPGWLGYFDALIADADPTRIFGVSHHPHDDNPDFLTRQGCDDLTWLYTTEEMFYPGLMFNREPRWDNYGTDKANNVGNPDCMGNIKTRVTEVLDEHADAQLAISVEPTATGARVTVTGECNDNYDRTGSRLTLYLTEDSIRAQAQRSHSVVLDEFWHMNVVRYENGAFGQPVSWEGNSFSKTMDITIDKAWKKENLKFVAMLNRYNRADKRDNRIENATGIPYSFVTAVGSVKSTDERNPLREAGRYNAAGQRISGPQRGLNIIRYQDGSTKKVLVK